MIIPMIDIMLFLLVFFMISTIYMVQTNSLPVSLPQSSTIKQETRPNVVPITVLESGDVLFDKDSVPNQQLAEKVHKALESDGLAAQIKSTVREAVEVVPTMEPQGMMLSPDQTDIHATEGNKCGFGVGEWIPYMRVEYKFTKRGGDPQGPITGTFMPMSADDGPHYGANVKMHGSGTYSTTLRASGKKREHPKTPVKNLSDEIIA